MYCKAGNKLLFPVPMLKNKIKKAMMLNKISSKIGIMVLDDLE